MLVIWAARVAGASTNTTSRFRNRLGIKECDVQFEFNEQQRMIRDLARDFAAREIAPIAAEIDEQEKFPADVVKKMGELGFMGMNVPEQ